MPETPWQQVSRVTARADTLDELIAIYLERNVGRPGTATRDEAMAWALDMVERYGWPDAPPVTPLA